jgi:hypothetical protein
LLDRKVTPRQGPCPVEAVKGAGDYNLAVTELMLVAIDWSGRSDDRGRTTWMAVIEDGVFRVLENGRSRPEVRKELSRLRRMCDRLVVDAAVSSCLALRAILTSGAGQTCGAKFLESYA